MGEHLEIAKKFVQEQLQKRGDITGVLLVGSVASEEETECSDIDLRLIIESTQDASLHRDGIDVWQDGIYIDAALVPQDVYADLDQILTNPTRANDLNSGRILYDPTGFLTQMQKATQAVFMAPAWVAVRIKPLVEQIPQHILRLQEAIDTEDHRKICIHAGRIVFGCAVIPLIQHGIAPSSTRHLIQLGHLSERTKNRLCEFEGASHMDVTDVLAILPIFSRLSSVCETLKWGHLPDYMVKKVTWMTRNGYHREAIHTMWINSGFRVHDCLHNHDPLVLSETDQLVQDWLRGVNWEGKEILEGKLKAVTLIWEEIKTSIADLLSEVA
jgi:hypothetical protein